MLNGTPQEFTHRFDACMAAFEAQMVELRALNQRHAQSTAELVALDMLVSGINAEVRGAL